MKILKLVTAVFSLLAISPLHIHAEEISPEYQIEENQPKAALKNESVTPNEGADPADNYDSLIEDEPVDDGNVVDRDIDAEEPEVE